MKEQRNLELLHRSSSREIPRHVLNSIVLSLCARSFKEHFGSSPSQWRKEKTEEKSKIRIVRSKNREDLDGGSLYVDENNQLHWRNNMRTNKTGVLPKDLKIKDLSPLTVAYLRHIDPLAENPEFFGGLFMKLFSWAGARQLLNFPETKALAVYHDNPDITEKAKMRTSICVTVPEGTAVDGEIGKMALKGGTYAVAHFELKDVDEFRAAWDYLYGQWLPESGFQPDDGPPFESYLNDPKEHPEHISFVDIYLPVKPL